MNINFRTNLTLSQSTAVFDQQFVILLVTSQLHLKERNVIH